MCTLECARCEATFTVSEELCGECDEALDEFGRNASARIDQSMAARRAAEGGIGVANCKRCGDLLEYYGNRWDDCGNCAFEEAVIANGTWRERLGANFIAAGLAARLAMATFEITKAAYPKLDGFFAAAETARLLRAMAGIDPEDHRVEKAGAP